MSLSGYKSLTCIIWMFRTNCHCFNGHTFDRFLWPDDRGFFASFLTKDSLEVADGISVFGVDPV